MILIWMMLTSFFLVVAIISSIAMIVDGYTIHFKTIATACISWFMWSLSMLVFFNRLLGV